MNRCRSSFVTVPISLGLLPIATIARRDVIPCLETASPYGNLSRLLRASMRFIHALPECFGEWLVVVAVRLDAEDFGNVGVDAAVPIGAFWVHLRRPELVTLPADNGVTKQF